MLRSDGTVTPGELPPVGVSEPQAASTTRPAAANAGTIRASFMRTTSLKFPPPSSRLMRGESAPADGTYSGPRATGIVLPFLMQCQVRRKNLRISDDGHFYHRRVSRRFAWWLLATAVI